MKEKSDWSAGTQLIQISLSSSCFSFGLLALGVVLNQKSNTRCLALLSFIPLTQLLIEVLAIGEN